MSESDGITVTEIREMVQAGKRKSSARLRTGPRIGAVQMVEANADCFEGILACGQLDRGGRGECRG